MILKANDSDSTLTKLFAPMYGVWFETRATEEENRKIWKSIADVKKEGRKIDMETDYMSKDIIGISMDNIADTTGI